MLQQTGQTGRGQSRSQRRRSVRMHPTLRASALHDCSATPHVAVACRRVRAVTSFVPRSHDGAEYDSAARRTRWLRSTATERLHQRALPAKRLCRRRGTSTITNTDSVRMLHILLMTSNSGYRDYPNIPNNPNNPNLIWNQWLGSNIDHLPMQLNNIFRKNI